MTAKSSTPSPRSTGNAVGGDTDVEGDYAIVRRDGTGSNADGAGWCVHMSWAGRMIQASFHDHTVGSKEATHHIASAHRDAVLDVVPPLTNADMRTLVRKNRDPGTVPGVHYQKPLPTRPAYWIARIEVPVNAYVPGYVEEPRPSRNKKRRRQITRSFSIKRYGDEGARRLAEEERLRMLAAIKDASEPALRSERAKELHRELQGDER